MKRTICLLLCLCLCAALCSCSGKDGVQNLAKGYSRSSAIPEYDFYSDSELMPEEYDGYASAVTEFSIGLLTASPDQADNTVIAPVSVLMGLSLAANGAGTKTLREFERTIGGSLTMDSVNLCNHYLSSRIQAFNNDKGSVRLSNSLWCDDSFDIRPSFLQTCVDYYEPDIFRSVLCDTGTADINSWISDKTGGKLTDTEKELDPDTAMLLVNAMLLSDEWSTPYAQSALSSGVFHGGSTDSQVTYMTSLESYLRTDSATGFIKSFATTPCRFVAILPDEGMTAAEYLGTLTANRFAELLASQSPTEVCRASVPQFSVSGGGDVCDTVKSLGIKRAFSADEANFSAMTGSDGIYLSGVVQNSTVEIGPKGATASAATIVSAAPTEPQTEPQNTVTLDRPFIYAIIDNESEIPLLLGVINNL